MPPLEDADLTDKIINTFYTVYNELGYGFLEKVYCNALAIEFDARNIEYTRETPVDVFYKGDKVGHYRTDFIVEGRIAVEAKATRGIDEDDRKQTLNSLRATDKEVALLLNFGPKPVFHRFYSANSHKRSLINLSAEKKTG